MHFTNKESSFNYHLALHKGTSTLKQLRSYDGFFTDILATNSDGTKKQYVSALKDYENYCIKAYNRTLDQMIEELKQLNTQDQILVLQRWVNASESQPQTKRQRAGFVNKYLYYREINIDPRDWKQLKFGKMGKSFKKPLSKEILKLIFNRSSMKRKILYLFLISTGCRINEAVKLRKKDFDLSGKRIKIQIYQSKSTLTRIGYLTKECSRMIKPLLARLDSDDLVFGGNEDSEKSAVTEQQCFRRVTDLLGLGERRRSNHRHFTIHSLRSFTFTQFTKTHNADLAHAYIGREQYLDTYLNLPEEDQLEYFIKVEPLLFINEAEPETEAVIQLREENEKIRERLDSTEKTAKDFFNEVLTGILEPATINGQRVMKYSDKVWEKIKNLKTDEERMKNADLIKALYRATHREKNENYKQSKQTSYL